MEELARLVAETERAAAAAERELRARTEEARAELRTSVEARRAELERLKAAWASTRERTRATQRSLVQNDARLELERVVSAPPPSPLRGLSRTGAFAVLWFVATGSVVASFTLGAVSCGLLPLVFFIARVMRE